MAKSLKMTGRNREIRRDFQNFTGFLKRLDRRCNTNGLGKNQRTKTAMVKTLRYSIGGKSLAGTASNDKQILGVVSDRLVSAVHEFRSFPNSVAHNPDMVEARDGPELVWLPLPRRDVEQLAGPLLVSAFRLWRNQDS